MENGNTRGLSLRELVLEIYQDVKEIKTKYPSRKEMYSLLGLIITVVGSIAIFV